MTAASYANSIAGVVIGEADTVRQHQLGQIAHGENGSMFIYVQFAAATVPGDAVHINKDFLATLLTTSASPFGAPCGVGRATAAINQYGWAQRRGQGSLNVAASCAANARVNTTATAGRLDDDGTTGAKVIEGVILNAAAGGAAAVVECTLDDPRVGATLS